MVWGGDRDDNVTNCLHGPCVNEYNLTKTNHHFLIENWESVVPLFGNINEGEGAN